MRRWLSAAVLALVSACAVEGPAPGPGPVGRDPVPPVADVRFPATSFSRSVNGSNQAMAQDFLDLTFALEGGVQLRNLLRYEGPVAVYLNRGSLPGYAQDLEDLLARIRAEAGIDIRSTPDPARAQIIIEGVPFRTLQTKAPGAACIVKPGESSWAGFRRKSSRQEVRWSSQRVLGRTAVFISSDIAPQDIRSCLHEEIAQALGPANDLYRLADSVFNDDNANIVLTSFDMLMLRVLYNPAMRSGLPRGAVAARLPGVLDAENPGGRGRGQIPRAAEDPAWNADIAQGLTRGNSRSRRLRAVNRAIATAERMQPQDHRLAVALINRGRLIKDRSPGEAARDFGRAHALLNRTLGPDHIRTGQASLHVALSALERGDMTTALKLSRRSIPVAERMQDAVLLSSLYAVQSRALATIGQDSRSDAARLEYLRWARYAYGDDSGRRARAQARIERALTAP